ncbi:MAG: phosphatase PAP2 family protein [Candidatus Gastranaerophilales bacterium]|nr:phosphatase PAP2 family protein [Candidatus Gastranaerophilales bacterium]
MKKSLFLISVFIIYAIIVNTYPVVTQWDMSVIEVLQRKFEHIPSWIPVLMDGKLYAACIVLPLLVGIVFFFKETLIIDIILFSSSPLVAYVLNIIIKNLVQRPRPPIELQFAVQPSTFSFVSSHTLVTTTLWGLVIYYINKYCKNPFLKYTGMAFGVIWILFAGLSRILLGVHNPTDVFGGYLLAFIMLYIYISMIKIIGGKG